MQALDAYDNQEFEESLRFFDQIADTSKILFNCGVIYATLGEHDKAVPFEQSMQQCYLPNLSYIHILRNSAHMGMFEEADKLNNALLQLK